MKTVCFVFVLCLVGGCGVEMAQNLRPDVPSDIRTTVSATQNDVTAGAKEKSLVLQTDQLDPPIRLMANGQPIDIGTLSSIAHAGPWIADVDTDGDQDLLVGDFPGYFWFFENENNDEHPQYVSKGKLQAGGVDAKTPVY